MNELRKRKIIKTFSQKRPRKNYSSKSAGLFTLYSPTYPTKNRIKFQFNRVVNKLKTFNGLFRTSLPLNIMLRATSKPKPNLKYLRSPCRNKREPYPVKIGLFKFHATTTFPYRHNVCIAVVVVIATLYLGSGHRRYLVHGRAGFIKFAVIVFALERLRDPEEMAIVRSP